MKGVKGVESRAGAVDERTIAERDVYYWCGGFIEATFRHSLGPGVVRGICPLGRRKEVGNPSSPRYFRGGVQAGLPQPHAL